MAEAQNSPGLPDKLYFRIGEVAELVGVEPHVLRYWEREFRAIRPSKSARGQRVYSRRDVENLLRVRQLLYSEGFTIAGAKKKLKHPADAEAIVEAPPAEGSQEAPKADAQKDVPSDGCSRARTALMALREEIEGFLAELDSSAP